MDKDSIKQPAAEAALFAGEAWFDPIEAGLRGRIRGFLEELTGQELGAALGRGRYERGGAAATAGHRHGHRTRRLTGSFGGWRSPCRGRGCGRETARSGNGAAPRCRAMPGAPARSRR